MLDLCGINSYITWKWKNQQDMRLQRGTFIKNLSLQLMKPWIERRPMLQPQAMYPHVREALEGMDVEIGSKKDDGADSNVSNIRNNCSAL
jgi:hypothetical protein